MSTIDTALPGISSVGPRSLAEVRTGGGDFQCFYTEVQRRKSDYALNHTAVVTKGNPNTYSSSCITCLEMPKFFCQ